MTATTVIAQFVIVFFWLLGIVIVKGAWATAAAIFLPPYAFYIVVEYAFLRWLA